MYYPKSRIKTGFYTTGNEYVEKTSNKEYKGDYFKTYDNRFYSGKEPSPSSVELVPFKKLQLSNPAINPSMYAFMKNQESRNKVYPPPKSEKPLPSDSDYKNGFFERYFAKRRNGGLESIQEISKSGYDETLKNPLYQTVSLKWKLTGPLRDDTSNSNMPVYGIADTNSRSIREASKKINELPLYLTNLSELARVSQ